MTRPDAIPRVGERLREFLAAGAHGDMAWLAANADRRGDPRALWPDVRSIVMLGVNYGPDDDPLAILKDRARGAISVYAQGDDYHELIKARLKTLGRWLIDNAGGDIKVFVDTAPVMEKPLAAAAGIGWQGKHTNLVSRERGSWLFLGAIFTTLDLPPDAPEVRPLRHLPRLSRCLPDRCISRRRTGSMRGAASRTSPSSTKARSRASCGRSWAIASTAATIVWRFARGTSSRRPAARPSWRRATRCARRRLAELARLDDAAFRALFTRSPVKRIGRARFLRNVLIAIGNSADATLADEAERLLDDAAPLVRGAAVWALGRLDRARLEHGAAERRAREDDRDVIEEWAEALSADADAGPLKINVHIVVFRIGLFGGTFRRQVRRWVRTHRRHGAWRRTRRGVERTSCRSAQGAGL